MEKTLQITKLLKGVILIVMFGLFLTKVYISWIYLSLLALMLIIRYIEVKKGDFVLNKNIVITLVIGGLMIIMYFVYISS